MRGRGTRTPGGTPFDPSPALQVRDKKVAGCSLQIHPNVLVVYLKYSFKGSWSVVRIHICIENAVATVGFLLLGRITTLLLSFLEIFSSRPSPLKETLHSIAFESS